MIEAFVDQSWQATMRDRIRVAAIHREGRRLIDGKNGTWVQLSDDLAVEPEEVWALDLPVEAAQAVYQALRRHFGDADLETARALTKARDASEVRRIALEDAVIQLALRGPESR